jgi:hypothetical protein
VLSSEQSYDSRDDCHDLPDQNTLNVNPSFINNVIFDTKRKRKRENKKKLWKENTSKQLSKQRLSRKIRMDKAYGKVIANYRKSKKGKYFHFFGDWLGIIDNVKGIKSRRSTKPIVSRLNSVPKDMFILQDEYKSTITYNSCFSRTIPQVFRRKDKLV